MERLQVEGTLPVAINLVANQKPLKLKKVVMRSLTTEESLLSQGRLLPGQFIAIGDLAAMTNLVDDEGTEHQMLYEHLAHTSKANYKKLQELEAKLEEKETAESTKAEHD